MKIERSINKDMLSFKEYNNNQNLESLMEALITFGGKAYPKFGNVVIMAGGAGSGKGFILDKLVGIEGKVFDVDVLKSLALRSEKIGKRVKRDFGKDLDKMDLKNPDDVSSLHDIMADLGVTKRKEKAAFSSILAAPKDRKPNLIFDVTLKDMQKLSKITQNASNLGYPKENIHIVWVVNDIEIAKKQNLDRPRRVPTEILVNTHRGVSSTMHDVLSLGSKLRKYMDGDIVFAFNKIGVDASVSGTATGGFTINKANYVYVKRKGKPAEAISSLKKDIRSKLNRYVPKGVEW